MIRKPQYKIARRLGEKIFPKTQTQKFSLRAGSKTTSKRRPAAKTEYGQQFLEKQKVRLSYGVLEKQFAGYVREAREQAKGNPAVKLFTSLETRLDNVVFRLGLAPSRAAARQMVAHGHVCVNGTRVTIPSYRLSLGDVINVREASKKNSLFRELTNRLKNVKAPEWLYMDPEQWQGRVQALPMQINSEASLNFHAVLELYSRA